MEASTESPIDWEVRQVRWSVMHQVEKYPAKSFHSLVSGE
jgi:hypothetical protein